MIFEVINWIAKIPALFQTLSVEGNIITIDAKRTQTIIANKIIKNVAEYIGNYKKT